MTGAARTGPGRTRIGPESKPPWRAVPGALRQHVEALLGAPITRGLRVWGGYAPSATFRLFLADGRHAVFKGTNATSSEFMRAVLRDEERVYRELGSLIGRWAPAFYGSAIERDWHAIVLEDVGPAQVPPWTPRRAAAALRDYAAFHSATFGRVDDLPDWVPRQAHHRFAQTWRHLADESGGLDNLAALAGEHEALARRWLAKHVDRLRSSAERLAQCAPPHALLHLDTRSDNLRIQPGGRLRLFDWPYACIAPHELDVVAFVQSIEAEGGPLPERGMAWYAEGIVVRSDALDASIAAVAGYFANQAWRPPIPGLPRVRSIQRRQLRSTLRWWARHAGQAEPDWLAAVPD